MNIECMKIENCIYRFLDIRERLYIYILVILSAGLDGN